MELYLMCLVVGFALGYGVREAMSRNRRARARRGSGSQISKSGMWTSRVHTRCSKRGLIWFRRQTFLFGCRSRKSMSKKN